MNESLGAPVHDPVERLRPDPGTSCGTTVAPFPLPHTTHTSRSRYWVVAAAFAALIAGLALGWLTAERGEQPAATPPASVAEAPATITGAAELFAGLYLSGDVSAADLAPFHAGEVPPLSGSWINDVVAMSAEPVAPDRWQVTVVVDALEPVDEGYVRTGLTYYDVAVEVVNGRPVMPTAPARVPAPTEPAAPITLSQAVTAEQANLAQAFVTDYLTGDARPAAGVIGVFATTPYESVDAVVRGVDPQGRVVVAVTASTASGTVHRLDYAVTLEGDRGQWEVSDIGAW